MTDPFSEYGFWALVVVVACTALQALGAWLGRRPFLRLAQLALSVDDASDLTGEDKRAAGQMMSMATAWYTTPALMFAAPFVAFYVCGRAIYLAVSGQGVTEVGLLRSFPKTSRFTTIINDAVWKSRPLVVIWGAFWMIPVLLVLALTHGSTKLLPALINRASIAVFARVSHR